MKPRVWNIERKSRDKKTHAVTTDKGLTLITICTPAGSDGPGRLVRNLGRLDRTYVV